MLLIPNEITMTERSVENIINARRVILGPSDKVRAVHPLKYPWARSLKRMIANDWRPVEVDMTKSGYKNLRERESYDQLWHSCLI